uniref:Uncharacterized protein n=1 Tax=Panagrolaimus sp. ES5 TaxID=591445 RepID=A0AC34GMZ6_9BILA
MKLRSGKVISEPDVVMTDLTNNDNIPSTSADPNIICIPKRTVALQPQRVAHKFLNYHEFRVSAYRQIFSLPESIIFYMAKNPPSSGVYLKMIKCCKYFFAKNPILHLHCLHSDGENDGWKTCINRSCHRSKESQRYRKINLDMSKIQCKLWVRFRLQITSSNSAVVSSVIPKLYNGYVKKFTIVKQNLSFNQLLFISQSVETIYLMDSAVFYDNGTEVPCEVIIQTLPKLEKLFCGRPNILYDYSKTAAHLLKIPHFKNLKCFSLTEISESFDMDTFFKHLKQNTQTMVGLKFSGPLSDGYKEKLQAFVDETLEAEIPRAYLPPLIVFNGQLRRAELRKLWLSYL